MHTYFPRLPPLRRPPGSSPKKIVCNSSESQGFPLRGRSLAFTAGRRILVKPSSTSKQISTRTTSHSWMPAIEWFFSRFLSRVSRFADALLRGHPQRPRLSMLGFLQGPSLPATLGPPLLSRPFPGRQLFPPAPCACTLTFYLATWRAGFSHQYHRRKKNCFHPFVQPLDGKHQYFIHRLVQFSVYILFSRRYIRYKNSKLNELLRTLY